ncbi:MerR family transcriptional regulator [Listeria weihenstephanensis FSL R9-0317]|uniref:MerR family transcriptional regulator n=1 Tax=Listeria weihenstephanensis TaxID=1006155 RepID=A0A1S7FQT2_9LIST|nr:MerR family transcriptional regulator [Listeria weihenstephanensis]AQY49811.1 MerR family transcriptional regulator [Listeria weihenstephanensis]EUJ34687.1 MerR family transcriptional regulator [Listeria weihenstephanensis FSL R9-0317]MBC1499004.1 MerR family transcriptional regulator [Listeria weihenstephanensis]
MYSIGETAKMVGLSAYTLRYYEKEKIISPSRNANGERAFDDQHIKWLQFVIRLKATQMPIAQIREYTELFLEGEHTARQRLELLQAHQLFIQEQLQNLTSVESELQYKIENYERIIASPMK